MPYRNAIVEVGTPLEIGVVNLEDGFFLGQNHIEINAEGTNVLKVETKKRPGNGIVDPDYIQQSGGLTGESIVLDMHSIQAIRLTAIGGDVQTQVHSYKVSTFN